jgi:hypothetical protein
MGGSIDTLSVNRLMDRMIASFFPAEHAARASEAAADAEAAAAADAEAAATRDAAGGDGADSPSSAAVVLPLFVLDPTLPGQRIQLRVFEPRYLRMVERSLRGTRRFGMVGFTRYVRVSCAIFSACENGQKAASRGSGKRVRLFGVRQCMLQFAPPPPPHTHTRHTTTALHHHTVDCAGTHTAGTRQKSQTMGQKSRLLTWKDQKGTALITFISLTCTSRVLEEECSGYTRVRRSPAPTHATTTTATSNHPLIRVFGV